MKEDHYTIFAAWALHYLHTIWSSRLRIFFSELKKLEIPETVALEGKCFKKLKYLRVLRPAVLLPEVLCSAFLSAPRHELMFLWTAVLRPTYSKFCVTLLVAPTRLILNEPFHFKLIIFLVSYHKIYILCFRIKISFQEITSMLVICRLTDSFVQI